MHDFFSFRTMYGRCRPAALPPREATSARPMARAADNHAFCTGYDTGSAVQTFCAKSLNSRVYDTD